LNIDNHATKKAAKKIVKLTISGQI
jgi:hypothetical protein